MKYFEYTDKEKKEKAKAVDVLSMLDSMAALETFNGVTKEKCVENWYEIKRQLRDVLLVEKDAKE